MIPLRYAVLMIQAVISVHTELVAVPVTVTDGRGHHVSGLRQENFRVFENGRPRDFREQYTLGFAPGTHADARAFRPIDVRVSAAGQGRLHVRTRSGYAVRGDKDDKRENDAP